ncbi:MAG: hypothetical protein CM15mP74_37300 [Halieaceae bacterium]|nr:MAG: hypothetical protein CM15mP74_37300 [Halieaceae bacterium]
MSDEVTGNNPTELTDFQRDRIDAALQDALEAKGFVFVDKTADADLLLSWHLNLMEKTDGNLQQPFLRGLGRLQPQCDAQLL